MGLKLNGATSGSIEIDVPAVAGTDTAITIPATSGGEFIVSDSAGDVNLDNGTFFVDASTNRCGIGTTSPARDLSIGDGSDDVIVNLMSGTGQFCLLDFGDTDNNAQGRIAYFNDQDCMTFRTGGSGEDVRIDSSGRLLVGTSTSRSNWFNTTNADPLVQLEGSSSTRLSITRNDNTDNAGELLFGNSRSSAYGLVSNNDSLGRISFQGADGSEMVAGAYIQAFVDADPGTNSVSGRLVFSTNTGADSASPTERMRIQNNGRSRLFSNAEGNESWTAQPAGTTFHIYAGGYNRTSTTSGGTTAYAVWSNGNVQNGNNSYGQLSDIKLKENIVDASSQWDDLKAIQVRNFNFKEGQTHTQIGLIAQEVELVSPGLVTESPDRETVQVPVLDENGDAVLDENGDQVFNTETRDLGTTTKSVSYSVLYMKAVKALQEAMERIETLEAKVAQLEGGAA